jgi:hypothetical protein
MKLIKYGKLAPPCIIIRRRRYPNGSASALRVYDKHRDTESDQRLE